MVERNKRLNRDLLAGPIYSVLFSVSIPLMFNNLIASFYNLADGLWVAQLSIVQFSATSFVWPPHYLFVSLGIGLAIAATAIIAQLLGQDEHQKAESYATHVVLFCLALGVLLSGFGSSLAPSFVRWMGATGELASLASVYLSILLLGYFFEIAYLAFYAILSAQGKTKVTMIISVFSSILNVVLDPLFIFEYEPLFGLRGLGMGIAGAAWATVIAQAVKVLLGLVAIRSRANNVRVRLRGVRLKWRKFFELMRVGFPTALGQSSAAIGFTVLNSVVAGYGTATLSAYAAVNRINGFLTTATMGVGGSMTPIIGQNLGAGKKERVKKFVRAAFIISTVLSVTGALLQWILRSPLLSLYNLSSYGEERIVWQLAMDYMIYSVLMAPFMGYFDLFAGIFSGSGYQRYSAMMSIGRLWGLRLPMIFLFQRYTNIGEKAIWIAMLASNVLIDLFGFFLYRKGKWFNEPKLKH
ncbi:MAG: MATE family efflux transporter [Clostridiaceae bacterium]|nr:MATE family efflux transporter [Clostridiaceae bacterium]